MLHDIVDLQVRWLMVVECIIIARLEVFLFRWFLEVF
jgi:hypothetical protein